jgi:competence protein ComGC
MSGLAEVRWSEESPRSGGTTTSAHRGGGRRGAALAETLVGLQIVAIIVALVFFTFVMTANQTRKSCKAEVLSVKSALAKYELQFGNTNPKDLSSLVPIGFLKSIPGPNSASTAAGFTYDPATGAYSGGTCP